MTLTYFSCFTVFVNHNFTLCVLFSVYKPRDYENATSIIIVLRVEQLKPTIRLWHWPTFYASLTLLIICFPCVFRSVSQKMNIMSTLVETQVHQREKTVARLCYFFVCIKTIENVSSHSHNQIPSYRRNLCSHMWSPYLSPWSRSIRSVYRLVTYFSWNGIFAAQLNQRNLSFGTTEIICCI